jgi:hypothetical protein
MQTENSRDDFNQALAELARLRQFAGTPAEFWPAFLRCGAAVAGASQAVLALRRAQAPDAWQKLSQWAPGGAADQDAAVFARQLRDIADQCARQGALSHCLAPESPSVSKAFALAVKLQLPKTEDVCIAAFFLQSVSESKASELLVRLQMVADTPVSYMASQAVQQNRVEVDKFVGTLDLMTLVNAEKRFIAAVLAFCNGIATRHHCDRSSLGWKEKGFVRLQAISHTEKFDRNMAAVKSLETAMEESMDQDEEILWPATDGNNQVSRDHEQFAREQNVKFICSVPLRLDGEVAAVLTCERQTNAFTEEEVRQLRLSCDQAVRRLADLQRNDRWLGGRLLLSARERVAKLVGVDHTWPKFLGVVASVALLLVIVLRLNYRVEAKFIVHSDELAYISAPFDGFIEEVPIRAGDPIKKEQALLSMDRGDLLLEESGAIADLGRYSREAEKSRAANALADMRIAQALAQQAGAKLELIRYRLLQATLKSPLEGVVAEGDQKERLGAPVKQGEVLFKVSRTDALYVEAEVHERDIHELATGVAGEIAFISQPKMKFPVKVTLIHAAAIPKDAENVFLVRCAIEGPIQNWWRPGMTGVCKINAGKRPLIWILTHRTMDYLRLLFWW